MPDVVLTDIDIARTEAFIDGDFLAAYDGQTFETIDPSTGRTLTAVSACNAADVDAAVSAARRSVKAGSWSRPLPAQRRATLVRFADLLESDGDELAALDCIDAGQPIDQYTETKTVWISCS